MDNLYQIYLITNLIDNKKYIGLVILHKGYIQRFKEHLSSIYYANTRLLSNAIKKYGEEAFSITLIESDIPAEAIDDKEVYYIDYYNTFYLDGQGYNMTHGRQGIHGYKHTEGTKELLQASARNFWKTLKNNEEKLFIRNLKISNKLKNIPKSPELRKNLSTAAKKRFENSHGTFFGRHHTDETKKLLAKAHGHPVAMLDKESEIVLLIFDSATDASRYLLTQGITTNKSAFTRIITICNKVKGQGKTAYGYKWEYLDNLKEGVTTIQ